jgi:HlyD family secretion protein
LEEGTRPEEVRAAARQVEQARAQLRTAEVSLAKTKLYAPADGVVTARNLEAGEAVAPGVPVVSLVDLDHPWVYIYIPEPELAQVKLGAKAQVTADSLKQALPGEVVRVYEKAEFTPRFIQTERERVNLVFRAKVGVQNPEHVLRPGMPADVQLQ